MPRISKAKKLARAKRTAQLAKPTEPGNLGAIAVNPVPRDEKTLIMRAARVSLLNTIIFAGGTSLVYIAKALENFIIKGDAGAEIRQHDPVKLATFVPIIWGASFLGALSYAIAQEHPDSIANQVFFSDTQSQENT